MNLKILIIEDETIVALHIKKTVTMLGHTVIKIVKNSTDALVIAKKSKINLMISDINIQGDVDGVECCKTLQKLYNIPVIFITAYRDAITLEKASHVDFIGYLVKPFREDELETLIQLAILKYGLLTKQDRYVICDRYSYCYNTDELFFNNDKIELTKKENKLLLSLIEANGSVVFYSTLEYKVWEGKQVSESSRRQLVHRFKQKLPHFPLELAKGFGYKLKV